MTKLALSAALLALNATAAAQTPARDTNELRIEQKLGAQLPLSTSLVDSTGRHLRLSDVMGEKPAILVLAYYECPMLCSQVMQSVVRSLRPLSLTVGEDLDVIVVSIDPSETPAQARSVRDRIVDDYGRGERGWHFLTATTVEDVDAIASTVGFRYRSDPETGQFAHASGITLLTPEGRIARYFLGLDYPSRDLRLSLVEASQNTIGSPVDQLILLCVHWDPTTGRYGLVIMNALRVLGGATLLLLGAVVGGFLWRDRRRTGRAA